MRRFLIALLMCLFVSMAWASTTPAADTCNTGCTCTDEDGDGDSSVTKLEGLAAAVGALTPLVLGGAGLGLYKVLKGSPFNGPDVSPEKFSPRLMNKRGSIPSYKDSPALSGSSYYSMRRGSTPLSLLGEDDDISFPDTPRTSRPDTTPSYTNVHRPNKGDTVNKWM